MEVTIFCVVTPYSAATLHGVTIHKTSN